MNPDKRHIFSPRCNNRLTIKRILDQNIFQTNDEFVFDHTKSPKIYYQNQPSLKGQSKIFVNNADQSKACYVFKSLPGLAVHSDG